MRNAGHYLSPKSDIHPRACPHVRQVSFCVFSAGFAHVIRNQGPQGLFCVWLFVLRGAVFRPGGHRQTFASAERSACGSNQISDALPLFFGVSASLGKLYHHVTRSGRCWLSLCSADAADASWGAKVLTLSGKEFSMEDAKTRFFASLVPIREKSCPDRLIPLIPVGAGSMGSFPLASHSGCPRRIIMF